MIKRYDVIPHDDGYAEMAPFGDGDFVYYEDHLTAIEQAKIEAQIETLKRTMMMQLPTWLDHKLKQEINRCEHLLKLTEGEMK